jgi:hypothetical protein
VNPLLSATSIIIKTVLEYGALASRPELSEAEADRMDYILIEASNNPLLALWLDQIDYCLGYRLGLMDETSQTYFKNRQAQLGEHLGVFLEKGDQDLSVENLSPLLTESNQSPVLDGILILGNTRNTTFKGDD